MKERKETNWFDGLTAIFGWVQIMLSPTLVGLALGGIYYLYSPDIAGKVVFIICACIGLLIGIVWATRVKKRHGTIWFISRIMATPELEKKDGSTAEKNYSRGDDSVR